MKTLAEVRKEIDSIDRQLLTLFQARMDCAKEVAQIKRQEHLPVLNPKREEEILREVEGQGGEYGSAAKVLFSTMMDVSRALQHDALGGGDSLRAEITAAVGQTPGFSASPRVAWPGVAGSFSHEAAGMLFPNASPDFYETFSEVADAVNSGRADYGILPVENSSAGSVVDSYDLVLHHRFFIVGATDVPIHHCCAGVEGAELSQITDILSHPQGLAQCSDFIRRHNLRKTPCTNTAVAAKHVAEAKDNTKAAVCSALAAKRHGLRVLARDIQNANNNCTRFIVISKALQIPHNADKISLCFSLPHTTGSLYRTLGRFSLLGLNLTKIESRPIAGKSFEYLFTLDFAGSVADQAVLSLLCALSDELPNFSFLGNYRETKQEP